MICDVCGERPASHEVEGHYGEPWLDVCDECHGEDPICPTCGHKGCDCENGFYCTCCPDRGV